MIEAIETAYNDYRFRSRLEARWAVFFDYIHLPYYYEYQGYNLDGLWYLPDFYIPKWKCYFEVKPPLDAEGLDLELVLEKARRLRNKTRYKVIIAFGGFSSEGDYTNIALLMPGYNTNYLKGAIVSEGVFGNCNGVDALYFRPIPEKDVMGVCDGVHSALKISISDPEVEKIRKTIDRHHLVPLHSSIGFDFAMIKERVGFPKIFAPFLHPLLCNFNAPYFNKFKPYTEAYKAARQARF